MASRIVSPAETDTPGIFSIPVGPERHALVEAADLVAVLEHSWWSRTGGRTYYAYTTISKRCVLMHRFLMDAPRGIQVDHINGNGLDNRRDNLRLATQRQNSTNITAPPTGKTGLRGVSWVGNRWQAIFAGKRIGSYNTAEEAIAAYNHAALSERGEFARPHPLPIEGRLAWMCEELDLSPRESQVFLLSAEGCLPISEIAERLEISIQTVRVYMSNIRAKRDVRQFVHSVVQAENPTRGEMRKIMEKSPTIRDAKVRLGNFR